MGGKTEAVPLPPTFGVYPESMTRDRMMQKVEQYAAEARKQFDPLPWEAIRSLGKAQGILACVTEDDAHRGVTMPMMDVITVGRELDQLQSKLAVKMH